jgi:hypothetical protein
MMLRAQVAVERYSSNFLIILYDPAQQTAAYNKHDKVALQHYRSAVLARV